jgi:hypothetical protein
MYFLEIDMLNNKIIFLLINLVIFNNLSAQEFRNFPWGTSEEDIILIEGEPSYASDIALSYNSKEILGYNAETEFILIQGKLYMGTYIITNLSQQGATKTYPSQICINVYNDIKRKMIVLYGNQNSTNQISKNPSYVTTFIESQWSTENSFITLEIIFQPIGGKWAISITYYSPVFAQYNGFIMN